MRVRLFVCLALALTLSAAHAQTAASAAKPEGAKPAAAAPSPSLPTTETVTAFMQRMFGYNTTIKWQVVRIEATDVAGVSAAVVQVIGPQGQQTVRIYVLPDQQHAMVGEMIPFGTDPFAAARGSLARGMNGIVKGPANAALTIVEFGDLQCPSCKAAQPTIERLLSDHPGARFVFQHFPLPQHNWAMKAAGYADCVGRSNNTAFWKFAQSVYDAQAEITIENADVKLKTLATAAGADGAAAAACSTTPETRARIERSVELGKQVGVGGTPTLFFNGRKISNVEATSYETLNAIAGYDEKQKP